MESLRHYESQYATELLGSVAEKPTLYCWNKRHEDVTIFKLHAVHLAIFSYEVLFKLGDSGSFDSRYTC